MSKPLELTVYPTFWLSGTLLSTAAPGATIADPIDVDLAASAKRFLDAELAAEVQQAELICRVRRSRCERYPEPAMWDHYERGIEQSFVLHRFATLPHYDEDTQ